jgi:hypothetical protein
LDQQQYDHPTYGLAKRVRIGQNPSGIGDDNRGGGLREYTRVYTDGSIMDERLGYAIVMGQRQVKIILAGQMSMRRRRQS